MTNGKTPQNTMNRAINQDMLENKSHTPFKRFGAGRYSIKERLAVHIASALLSPEEAAAGMTLFPGSALRWIPEVCQC